MGDPVNQEHQILYKDFIVWASPMQVAESGEWTLEVHIMRKNGDAVKRYFSKNTFQTEWEAVYHSVKYGKMIIDGKIAGCSITNI
jgi:hypothetical protein